MGIQFEMCTYWLTLLVIGIEMAASYPDLFLLCKQLGD